jgi:serine/threonine protein kinase
MGEVYLAEHRRLPRRVAVKMLLAELSANESLVERFFAEARATAVIRHPNIVEVIDCDIHQGRAYIVMELLDGETLGARLRRAGPFTELRDVAEIGRQIADGVGAAHAKRIVHRDLKPDNVFLLPQPAGAPPHIKVLDFGVAKLVMEGGGSHTRTGTIIGTPLYMSPEQCRGTGQVDHRTDIYSLGCILFEMVCGRPPFMREGSASSSRRTCRSRPPPPSRSIRPRRRI